MSNRKHTTVEGVRHHGDPVADDIKNQANHDVLKQKRTTAMHQDTWPGDGTTGPLPDYQHGDPLDYEKKSERELD